MNIVKVVAPFSVSIVLFILSYLTRDAGYLWLFYAIIGVAFGIFGVYFATRD